MKSINQSINQSLTYAIVISGFFVNISFAGVYHVNAKAGVCVAVGEQLTLCQKTTVDPGCMGNVEFNNSMTLNQKEIITGTIFIDSDTGVANIESCVLTAGLGGLSVTGTTAGTFSGDEDFTPTALGNYSTNLYHVAEQRWRASGSDQKVVPYTVSVATSTPPVLQLNGRAAFLNLLSAPAFAQEKKVTQAKDESLIADVEISQANIVRQSDRVVDVALTLEGDIAQIGIRYGVELRKKEGGKSITVDTQVAQEIVNLSQNEKRQINVSFTFPQKIVGQYEVIVRAYTNKGLGLASKQAGEITFLPAAPAITITSCDQSKTSSSTLICSFKNNAKVIQTASVYTVIREGNIFGNDVGTPVRQALTLKANESKFLSFTTLGKDVSHTSVVSVTSNDGKVLYDTKSVVVYGVRKPAFDNVFMIATDTDIAVSGIVQRISSNPNKSQVMSVTLTDAQGAVCGTQFAPITDVRTDITLIPTCSKGNITATLSENGQVLDTQVIPFELAPKVMVVEEAKPTTSIPWWVWVLLVGVLVLGALRLNRKRDPMLV